MKDIEFNTWQNWYFITWQAFNNIFALLSDIDNVILVTKGTIKELHGVGNELTAQCEGSQCTDLFLYVFTPHLILKTDKVPHILIRLENQGKKNLLRPTGWL